MERPRQRETFFGLPIPLACEVEDFWIIWTTPGLEEYFWQLAKSITETNQKLPEIQTADFEHWFKNQPVNSIAGPDETRQFQIGMAEGYNFTIGLMAFFYLRRLNPIYLDPPRLDLIQENLMPPIDSQCRDRLIRVINGDSERGYSPNPNDYDGSELVTATMERLNREFPHFETLLNDLADCFSVQAPQDDLLVDYRKAGFYWGASNQIEVLIQLQSERLQSQFEA